MRLYSILVLIPLLAVHSVPPHALADEPVGGMAGGTPGTVFQNPSLGISGILDPTRLSVSNELSYFYASGSGGLPGGGAGLYQNRLTYKISDPLQVTLLLGYEFGSPFGRSYGATGEGGRILPGLALTYQPSENVLVRFQYRTLPSTAHYGYGRSGPYHLSYDPFWDE